MWIGACTRVMPGVREMSAADLAAPALVFAPHPDDETLGCGGTIIRKVRAGARVGIVVMTDGARSHAKYMAPARLAEIRAGEALAAASVLGVAADHVSLLGCPDGQLASRRDEFVPRVAELLAQRRPEQVFIPYRHDGVSDHEATREVVMAGLAGRQDMLLRTKGCPTIPSSPRGGVKRVAGGVSLRTESHRSDSPEGAAAPAPGPSLLPPLRGLTPLERPPPEAYASGYPLKKAPSGQQTHVELSDSLLQTKAWHHQTGHHQIVILEYPVWWWCHWPWMKTWSSRARFPAALCRERSSWRARRQTSDAASPSPMSSKPRPALAQHKSQTTRMAGGDWPVLADVHGGRFLEMLMGEREFFATSS